MIEPTDKLVDLFDEASNASADDWSRDTRAGLAAVFTELAKTHCLKPAGHVFHPLNQSTPTESETSR